jgi:hypothetical protein
MVIGLVLSVAVAAADAQTIGYPPGVNPSNPQDLTHRSNPQDLLAPGGSNPQDLVRQPPAVNGPRPNLDRRETASRPTFSSSTSILSETVTTRSKHRRHHRRSVRR